MRRGSFLLRSGVDIRDPRAGRMRKLRGSNPLGCESSDISTDPLDGQRHFEVAVASSRSVSASFLRLETTVTIDLRDPHHPALSLKVALSS